ncbi:lipopolysaccharide biosynthesis protein [Neisseria sp. CCUG12390]|uniref:lipopolysaccharide biosynthesis protein n=1 Tax=Neisseria sp. CCUG12390 TaxID=3392035 RepID=UPI003A102423
MNARKILGYALGPVGSAAFGLVSLPLISWYFPADDIGRIVFLQTVSGLIILVLGLGLDQAYIRDYYEADNKASLFKSLATLPFLLVTLGSAAIAWWNPAWPSGLVFDLADGTLGLLFLLFLSTALFARFLSLILRMQEKAFAFSISQLIPKFFILAFVLLFVALGLPKNTFGLVVSYTAAQFVTVMILVYQTRRELKSAAQVPWSKESYDKALRYGLPLAFGNLAYWGFTSVDRFVLKEMASLEELGIYSMAVNFGAVALIFQSIFSTIWAPMVFKWVKDNENLDKIGHIAVSMTVLISAIVCIVGIFSPVVTWILPPKYEPVQFILLSSLLFPLFYTLTEVSGIGLNVIKKTWVITVINFLCLAVNLTLLRFLVPALGAKGAAIASAVSFCVFFIIKTELSSKLWQQMPRLKLYTNAVFCLAVCIGYTYFGTRSNYFIFALIWAAGLAGLVFFHKNQLSAALNTVKNRLKK